MKNKIFEMNLRNVKSKILMIIIFLVFTSAVCGLTIYILQHQALSIAKMSSEDIGRDLIVSNFASAERRIEMLKHIGQPSLSLVLQRDQQVAVNTASCLSSRSLPIIVDGLKLAAIQNCITVNNFASSVMHSPAVIAMLLISVILILATLTVKLRFQHAEIEAHKNQEMLNLSRQVAHDIRSPLSALNAVSSSLKDIPEDKRLMIRNAVQRINDIANDLLAKGKLVGAKSVGSSVQEQDDDKQLESILLPALVDSLVSEKRIQFRDQINVRIDSDFKNSFGSFVKAQGKELLRLLSNLINNSVEAFPDKKGEVMVAIRAYPQAIHLIIKDNGRGISPEVLEKLGEEGVSQGKDGTESGSGLGVYHAKKSIEAIGGKLNISSKVGVGTQIDILLPRANAPSWFLDSIVLQPGARIFCLDDDLTIHQIWKGRFESLQAAQQNIEMKSFTSAQEFKNFMRESSFASTDTKKYFLIDYELLGQSTTGLEVIEELGIRENVMLVTSRYEEPEIRRKCENLKIKILPKSLAGFVPVEIEARKEKNN